jgi:hypothetical protein
METKIERPAVVEDEYLTYLDDLRESSVTNMWGAGTYIEQRFNLSTEDADKVLAYWMNSFTERHPQ